MKKIPFLICLLFSITTASAYRFEQGNDIIISRPVYEDLYIAGGTITINAVVHGDLIIAGGTISINDSVLQDILLAGGNVTFNGYVGDDIRCAGGKLRISKDVKGDVVITGGEVVIDKGASIGGLMAGGGNITIDGIVKGNLLGTFGNLLFNGTAEKDFNGHGGQMVMNGAVRGQSVLAATEIEIGSKARFGGDVRYWNKKGSLDFMQSLEGGKAIYDPSLEIKAGRWYFLGFRSILPLLWYAGPAILMIMLLQYLFPAAFNRSGITAYSQTLRSLGSGFLYFAGVPVLAAIAFITVIGLPVGFMLLIFYMMSVLFSTVITSLVTVHWLNNRYHNNWSSRQMVLAASGTFILLKILLLIPVLGWLALIMITCVAFGAILLNVNWRRKKGFIKPDKQLLVKDTY